MVETSCFLRNISSVVCHSLQRYICIYNRQSTRQLSRFLLRVYPCPQKCIQRQFAVPSFPVLNPSSKQNKQFTIVSQCSLRHISNSFRNCAIQQHISSLQAKKRPPKKKSVSSEGETPYHKERWTVMSYSTAEEYDLEGLKVAVVKQGLYEPSSMPDVHDVLHASALYQVEAEPREIYFFREGTLVFWNIPDVERQSVLNFVKPFEHNPYDISIVQEESEDMDYIYAENKAKLLHGRIVLSSESSSNLEKYAFSNGIAISVKLGIWEASLDRFVKSIEWITANMKTGKKLTINKDQVFMKTGELFALRHEINLSSDLLDTPDFYWDRQSLETLYQKTCNHFNVGKRTRVMNEKLNHCCELMGLISDHLNDRHHVRLELMIIALIMIEVVFEFIHYMERYEIFGIRTPASTHDVK